MPRMSESTVSPSHPVVTPISVRFEGSSPPAGAGGARPRHSRRRVAIAAVVAVAAIAAVALAAIAGKSGSGDSSSSKAPIDAIPAVQGPNLLANGGFESATQSDALADGLVMWGAAQPSLVAQPPGSGTHAQRIDVVTGGRGGVWFEVPVNPRISLVQSDRKSVV